MSELKKDDVVKHITGDFADTAIVQSIKVDRYGSRLVKVCLQGRYDGRVTRTYYESNLERANGR